MEPDHYHDDDDDDDDDDAEYDSNDDNEMPNPTIHPHGNWHQTQILTIRKNINFLGASYPRWWCFKAEMKMKCGEEAKWGQITVAGWNATVW